MSIFAVASDGQLRLISEIWVHADYPRDSIASFRIAAATGALQFTGRFEPVGSPASMIFLKR